MPDLFRTNSPLLYSCPVNLSMYFLLKCAIFLYWDRFHGEIILSYFFISLSESKPGKRILLPDVRFIPFKFALIVVSPMIFVNKFFLLKSAIFLNWYRFQYLVVRGPFTALNSAGSRRSFPMRRCPFPGISHRRPLSLRCRPGAQRPASCPYASCCIR